MKKSIFLVSLMLILVVVGIAGSAMSAQAAPSNQTTGTQRLFGMGKDGVMGMPPGLDRAPFYYCQFAIDIVNPDLQYSKTIQKIVISDGSNGTTVKEFTPTGEQALLEPHEAFETDFPRLGIPPLSSSLKLYTVDVYWQGRGEPLVGYIAFAFWKIDRDAGQVLDLGEFAITEMVNLPR